MQEILKEIIKIDTLAFDTKKRSEEQIEERKLYYKNKMKEYEQEHLAKANQQANDLYAQCLRVGEEHIKVQEERAKQAALLVENRYLQIENNLLDDMFNELFVLED